MVRLVNLLFQWKDEACLKLGDKICANNTGLNSASNLQCLVVWKNWEQLWRNSEGSIHREWCKKQRLTPSPSSTCSCAVQSSGVCALAEAQQLCLMLSP